MSCLSSFSSPCQHRWYFYQKTKNYRVLFAALKGGIKTGGRLAAWTGLFVLSQDAVEHFVRTGLLHSGRGDETTRGVKAIAGATAGTGLAAIAGSFCASTIQRCLSLCKGS